VSGEFCALLCELRRLSGPLAGHRVHSRIVPRRSDVATRNAVRRVAIEVEGHSEYARINVSVVVSLLHSLRFLVRSRAALHLEILALRHQLAVTTRSRRRRGFRLFWTWKSRHRTGRPAVPHDVRALIREMSRANPFWGAPRTTPRSRFGLYGRRDHDRRDEHARDSNGTALAVAERLRSASLARSDGSH
jgi:hypothetical protein